MAKRRIPKHLFLELKSKEEDYPVQLKKLRNEKEGGGKHQPPFKKRLERGGYYQYRAAAYIHLHTGRELYELHPTKYLKEDPTKVALPSQSRAWRLLKDKQTWSQEVQFPEAGAYPGPNKFFGIDENGAIIIHGKLKAFRIARDPTGMHAPPYWWTPNHLIPIEAFSTDDEEPVLSDEVWEAIYNSGYDVNNGHNLMVSPRRVCDIAYHCVVPNSGSHPKYSDLALTEMRKVDESFKEEISNIKKDDEHAHNAMFDKLIDTLFKIETKLWKILRSLGRKQVDFILSRGTRPKPKHHNLLTEQRNKTSPTPWQRVKLG